MLFMYIYTYLRKAEKYHTLPISVLPLVCVPNLFFHVHTFIRPNFMFNSQSHSIGENCNLMNLVIMDKLEI